MELGPLARIIVRYAAGALIAKGLVSADVGHQIAADADIINYVDIALGLGLATATEIYYAIARKLGWAK